MLARWLFLAFATMILAGLGTAAVLALSGGPGAEADALRQRILVGLAVAALILLPAAWLLAQRLAEPVRRLQSAAVDLVSQQAAAPTVACRGCATPGRRRPDSWAPSRGPCHPDRPVT